jgi:hypothetical protein
MPLTQAQLLRNLLEDAVEDRPDDADARLLLRLLSWRMLAVKEGSGLTGRLAELARVSPTLEAFEAARDEELGPILDALEDHQNRDP